MNKTILNNEFKEKQLDVVISLSDQNRLWYTKVNSSAGYLFIDKNEEESTLIIDGRYIEYARENAQNVKVELLTKDSLPKFLKEKQETYKRIGFESNYATFDEYQMLKKWFPNAELIAINGQKLRIYKTEEEANLIHEAGKITLKTLDIISKIIKPGITEKQVEAEYEKTIRELGGEKSSFDMIVASGVRGALPHGRASDKVIEEGDMVTMDCGVYYQGYASDITRTIVVGEHRLPQLKEVEAILREAQKRGVAAVKPGVTTQEIDKVCRDYITEKGYGPQFVHSTGHGLGIDVHELPNVTASPKFVTTLEPGMIITVEPGIYIEGVGGIRVEDDVLVTKDGHRVLSQL